METTEKIVESYCRYVKGWFTLPNIRCDGQYEVDLLALAPAEGSTVRRYHIECGVSISSGFAKLTTKDFSLEKLKDRVQAAGQRRTLGYFVQRKFEVPQVIAKLAEFGFVPGGYQRVIATWDATPEARFQAQQHNIELWDFRSLLLEIAEQHKKHKAYFTDDTARTIQLFAMAARSELTKDV